MIKGSYNCQGKIKNNYPITISKKRMYNIDLQINVRILHAVQPKENYKFIPSKKYIQI